MIILNYVLPYLTDSAALHLYISSLLIVPAPVEVFGGDEFAGLGLLLLARLGFRFSSLLTPLQLFLEHQTVPGVPDSLVPFLVAQTWL